MVVSDINELFSRQSGNERFQYALSLIYQKYQPKHCFIARFKEHDRTSKVLCHLKYGELAENFTYTLFDTPCHIAHNSDGKFCTFNNVQQQFPKDIALQQWQINGYLGITLTSFEQKPVGLLVCLFSDNIEHSDIDYAWLRQLSNAIGSELSHQVKNHAYAKLLQQLEKGEQLANIGSWRWNMTNKRLYCSNQVYQILGFTDVKPQLTFECIKTLIHPDDMSAIEQVLDAVIQRKLSHFDICHRFVIGEQIKHVRLIAQIENDDDENTWLSASIQDVSAEHELQNQLMLSSIVFDHASDAILITDKHNNIVSVNTALENITGYHRDELLGRNPGIFSSGEHSNEFYQEMWQTLNEQGQWKGEIFNKRKNGEVYPEELAMNVVRDDTGTVCNYIAIFRDISQWKATEKKLKFYANNEPLTGLYNRRHFYKQIEQQISIAHRHNESFSVIMVNIDRFTEINTIHGQNIGDALLQNIAQRLQTVVRIEDTICRYSGDEFCILLPNTTVTGAEIVSQKIQQILHEPYAIAEGAVEITTSIGIAQYPLSGRDAAALLRNASYAMHSVKANGRNGIAFHDEHLQKQYLRKLILREKLKDALAQNKLQVYYQPIINLASREITKFEALVRWKDRNNNFISPAEFIAVAEEFGLIHLVGHFVLQQACNDLKQLHELGFDNISFSINRSICEFRHNGDESDSIEQTISAAGLPHSSIVIEITESVAMSSSSYTTKIIAALKQRGVKIALDDFCTGYSSLSYLIDYDADFIKIDKSFIDTMLSDNNSKILISTLIELANKLGMRVIAEGVENELQVNQLSHWGCHYIQGFYFSPALPFEQCLERLEQQQQLQAARG